MMEKVTAFNKKILILLLPLLAFSSSSLFAQKYPFQVGINYGYSLPMGQFASHEFIKDSVEYGAYALLGSNCTGEGTWFITDRLGVGINASISYYQIATGYYLIDKDANDPAAENFKLKSGPWTVKTLMLGIFYKIPLSDRFSLAIKGFGGLFQTDSPDQLYSANYFGIGTFTWQKTTARSNRYSFLAGAGLRYALFDHVDLKLDAEYTYSRAEFHFWDPSFTHRTTKYMKIPLLKVQPGLSILF